MKGSIRTVFGFLVMLAVAGSFDSATDAQMYALVPIGLAGALMALSGVFEMKDVK